MESLTKEYTDVKNIKHEVKHFIISDDEGNNRERILEELFHVLIKSNETMSAYTHELCG